MSSKFFQMRKKAKEETPVVDKKEFISTSGPTKKAYNFYYNDEKKLYIKEIVEYTDEKLVSISKEEIHPGLAMTMVAVKKLFTEKLVMKKEGI